MNLRQLKHRPKRLPKKYWLRLVTIPIIAKFGRFFGISRERLGETLGREVLIAEAAANRSVRVIDPSPTPLDTVFLQITTGHRRKVLFTLEKHRI